MIFMRKSPTHRVQAFPGGEAERHIVPSPAFSSAFFQHAASPFALSPAGNRTTPYFPRTVATRPANIPRPDSADVTAFLPGISYNADT